MGQLLAVKVVLVYIVIFPSLTFNMFRFIIFLIASASVTFGQSCVDNFELSGGQFTLDGVCASSELDKEACLCACVEDEACTAVDWNTKEIPFEGCRCWVHTQAITSEVIAPNENVDQYKKKSESAPEASPEEAADADSTESVDTSGIVCTIEPGHGTGPGATEVDLGNVASVQECKEKVLKEAPDANGLTVHKDVATIGVMGACFAEFSMTTRNDNTAYHSCIFETADETVATDDDATTDSNDESDNTDTATVCTLEPGHGTGPGATEVNLGDVASVQECKEKVLEQEGANGMTVHRDVATIGVMGACFAEFSMTTRN